MQQLVLEGLVTKPQRETAGSKTAVKLDYQQHWALARMIDLHLAGKDYLVAFEYHEDVLFMEPSDNPTSLDFAQVKTKEAGKPYRISDFVRPKKSKEHGELPSVMSKLISSLSGTVKAKSTRLLLVSNTRFSFETPSGIICATEIPIKEKKRIEDALAKHHPELNSKVIEKLFFHFTDMPLETAETYLRGKMVDLITSIFEKDTGISVTDLLQAIQGEIRRKNGYDSEKVKTVEDLKKHKCVSREYIEASMTRMVRAHSKVPNLDFIAKISPVGPVIG